MNKLSLLSIAALTVSSCAFALNLDLQIKFANKEISEHLVADTNNCWNYQDEEFCVRAQAAEENDQAVVLVEIKKKNEATNEFDLVCAPVMQLVDGNDSTLTLTSANEEGQEIEILSITACVTC